MRPRSSIRAKLAVPFTLVIGGISLVIFGFFPARQARLASTSLEAKARGVSSTVAAGLRSAAVFDDEEAMEQAIQGALANDDLLYIAVLDSGGRVRVSRSRIDAPVDAVESTGAGVGRMDPERLYSLETPIDLEGAEFGTLLTVFSLDAVHAEARRSRFTVGLLSLAILGVGLLAVVLTSAQVAGPLQEIVATTDRIARGNLRSRAPILTDDEVGQLAASFNLMVDRLAATQSEIEEANSHLIQVLENLPAMVAVFDRERRFEYVNPHAVPDPAFRDDAIGRPATYIWNAWDVDEEGKERIRAAMSRSIERIEVEKIELEARVGDTRRHLVILFSPIVDAEGHLSKLIGHAVDITELRAAERALDESQNQLRQAQKMEAIGRLAGGVAHDFNNMLSVIRGHTELLMLNADPDGPDMVDLIEIRDGTDRAAALTQQLLAFSRKHVLRTTSVDLNEVVGGIERMLGRLIGEDVRMTCNLLPGLSKVEADPGQLEQVLMNLVVNARDAMPRGGKLTIDTGEIDAEEGLRHAPTGSAPTGYVILAVSDTGSGMDEHTRARLFEPFFTTKGAGKGTGLGLATVYGIVHQSGGFIEVDSAPGEGSTFRVFLPVTPDGTGDGSPTSDGDTASSPPLGREEYDRYMAREGATVLLVEDEELVRNLARKLLVRSGYTVLVASDAEEALRRSEEHDGPIHVLLSDVIMPGLSGRELAERLLPLRPDMRVVYMSGYTSDELDKHGLYPHEFAFVPKPFTFESLIGTLRDTLDGTHPASMTV